MSSRCLAGRLSIGVLVLVLCLSWPVASLVQSRGKDGPTAESAPYEALKAEAEASYARGDYGQAAGSYEKALKAAPPKEEPWLRYRFADATWRGLRASQKDPKAAQTESSQLVWARQTLEELSRGTAPAGVAGRAWAESHESLGDYWIEPGPRFNWTQAWPHYQAALDWWAGSTDIETARKRYLNITFKCSRPYELGFERLPGNGAGPPVPLDTARGALKISRSKEEKAHCQFLVALALAQSRDASATAKTEAAFDACLALGKRASWYAAALYWYAQWSTGKGTLGLEASADCGRAASLFKRLASEVSEKESPFHAKAKEWLDEYGHNSLQLTVSSIFLPGVQPDFNLRYLRQKTVRFALYPVNLAMVPLENRTSGDEPGVGHWTESLDLGKTSPVKSWEKEITGSLACEYTVEHITMDWAPPEGAYVLEATGVGATARELILVTDMALVVKRSGQQVVVFACGGADGVPAAGVRVRLLEKSEGTWHAEAQADQDGVARFDLPHAMEGKNLVALASRGSKQAFAESRGQVYPGLLGSPIFYAYTDRPAYRPGDKVQWKVTVRRNAGKDLATPAGERIGYRITDPRQTKVKEGILTLNAFGSAWDVIVLGERPVLGEYIVEFHGIRRKPPEETKDDRSISRESEKDRTPEEEVLPDILGSATLFRVEEYKLPEFKVLVRTSEGDKPRVFRPTETVTATIQANYYSGEAVTDADVEISVYQSPHVRPRRSTEGIPWLEEDQTGGDYGSPGSQAMRRETVKTDDAGRAEFVFQPPDSPQDVEYRIEARVTDASRRMALGQARALVSRRVSYADLNAGGKVFRVGESLSVKIHVTDAYGNPQAAKGKLSLTRSEIREVWLDPEGNKVEGEALRKAKALHPKFPPPPRKNDGKQWVRIAHRFEEVKVQTQETAAGSSGEAAATFPLGKEGPYELRWSDSLGNVGTQAEQLSLLVVGTDVEPLRLSSGAFQIILSKPLVKPGERVRALIISPIRQGNVLVGLDGGGLHGFNVARLRGDAAVVEVEAVAGDSPCAYLCADMVSGFKLQSTSQRIRVPFLHGSLKVKLEPDREEYLPRQKGTWRVTTLDASGSPVAAEVALGVADDSIYAIQKDYARDPRTVFLAWERSDQCSTTSAFDLAYIKPPPKPTPVKVVPGPKARLKGTGIKGRVTDEVGQPVIGAAVQITGPSLRGFQGTATDVDGLFAVSLPPGRNYEVKVEAPGYNTVVRRGIEVIKDTATDLPIVLSQGETEIVVTAAAPVIDVKKTEVGTNITDQMISTIPLGRDSAGIAFLAPGTVASGLVAAETAPSSLPFGEVIVRRDFSATAFWKPDVVTNGAGTAVVEFPYPEVLTGWRATARAVTAGNQVGEGRAEVRTHQDLTVRLQCPRFLVAGDAAVVSAFIQNAAPQETLVAADLKAEGVQVLGGATQREGVRIAAKGSARVDWQVVAQEPGNATFVVQARGDRASDAMSRMIPILAHGMEVLASATGQAARGDLVLHLNVPRERGPKTTYLEIQISPGPAAAVLDALPYLVGYPYGCTEQTMSRFLPCVVAAKALKEQGLSSEAAARRILGPIRGAEVMGTEDEEGAAEMKLLEDMVDKGLSRLYGFHHSDGGWGWWEQDTSDSFMTAYVLDGLCIARRAGVKVPDDILEDGQEFLLAGLPNMKGDDNLAAWMLNAVASCHAELSGGESEGESAPQVPEEAEDALKRLWGKRATLTPYGQALLVLSAYHLGHEDWAKDLARTLAKEAKREALGEGQSAAFWGQEGAWWHWSLSPTETTATALRALLVADPNSVLCESAVAWLLAHRMGPRWNNTRDTALAVLAINDYLLRTREKMAAGSLEVQINGHRVKDLEIGSEASSTEGSRFTVDPAFVKDGENEIHIQRRAGKGPIFASALVRFFSQEEPVKAAGSGLSISRQYVLLKRQPTLLKGDIMDRQEIKDQDAIRSGDRIECVLTLTADHDTEYLVVEDYKPAGLEALQIRSGQGLLAWSKSSPGQGIGVYQELRDTKAAHFLTRVPAGSWEIRYELYAEAPGTFHAMPTQAYAMYAPHLKCNSDEIRLTIKDKPSATGE